MLFKKYLKNVGFEIPWVANFTVVNIVCFICADAAKVVIINLTLRTLVINCYNVKYVFSKRGGVLCIHARLVRLLVELGRPPPGSARCQFGRVLSVA